MFYYGTELTPVEVRIYMGIIHFPLLVLNILYKSLTVKAAGMTKKTNCQNMTPKLNSIMIAPPNRNYA